METLLIVSKSVNKGSKKIQMKLSIRSPSDKKY